MDYNCGQSTWPLLLVKALLSALQLFFSLAFSSLDSPLTQPLGNGFPRSSLTLNFFCLMDQLTQLLRNETIFTFLVFASFVVFFYGGAYLSSQIDQETTAERQDVQLVCFSLSSFLYFFLISLSYRHFKRGRRNGSSNIAFGCSRPTREGNECNLRTTVQF